MARRRARNLARLREVPGPPPPPPPPPPASSSTSDTSPDGRGRVGGCLHCVWEALKRWAFRRRTTSTAPRVAAEPGPAPPKRAAAFIATGNHAWKYQLATARKKEEPDEEEGDDQPQDGDLKDDQVLDNPYQKKKKYKEFNDARAKFSEKFELCHLCFFEGAPRFPWDGVIRRKDVIKHVYENHGLYGAACPENGCAVRFRTEEHRLLHVQNCQELLEVERTCPGSCEQKS
uniref:Uncharacterized protein n=1 Tax=Oryza sativa subsp. japonica TaxID=39947 RepID=Q2R203_ORYSJ|nr:hypothetical protein LOC_Os11g37470 [Oryza sativa Japonica Group]